MATIPVFLTVGAFGPGLLQIATGIDLTPFSSPGGVVAIDILKPDKQTRLSLTGAIAGDPTAGAFTADVPCGTFDQPGSYTVQAKLSFAGTMIYGVPAELKVKAEFQF